jgi:hypothetical protein
MVADRLDARSDRAVVVWQPFAVAGVMGRMRVGAVVRLTGIGLLVCLLVGVPSALARSAPPAQGLPKPLVTRSTWHPVAAGSNQVWRRVATCRWKPQEC